MSEARSGHGRCFEDFRLGEEIVHATPRTLTSGDAALYLGLYGSRFALNCSDPFARALGLRQAPIDDLLVFHVVLGKSVPDISVNAVANLGYAAGRFFGPVYPGDTLSARSTVIGLRENQNRESGIVYVCTLAHNQQREKVLEYARWAMVRKRDPKAKAPAPAVPDLPPAVTSLELAVPAELTVQRYDNAQAGATARWGDYRTGERIDHVDGVTVEEAEHMIAARLYQNTARVHFNQFAEKDGRFKRRLVYGGHAISLARALSFNGLANAFRIVAINGGRHGAPLFAGDTVFAWSEVLDKVAPRGREDVAAIRLRTTATRDFPCGQFPSRDGDGKPHPAVVLEFDYWALMPR